MLRFVFGCALLLLAACHNAKEFDRPAPEMLRLGEMTRQDVQAIYGEPTRQESTTVASGVLSGGSAEGTPSLTLVKLTYYFRDPAMVVLDPADIEGGKRKFLAFFFANERLVAYNFTSTFNADHMDFDEKKVALLENGKTARDELVALFGPPGGRAVFPMAPLGTEMYMYDYSIVDGNKRRDKFLHVTLAEDHVQDFKMVNETTPVFRSGGTVPIFIPRGK